MVPCQAVQLPCDVAPELAARLSVTVSLRLVEPQSVSFAVVDPEYLPPEEDSFTVNVPPRMSGGANSPLSVIVQLLALQLDANCQVSPQCWPSVIPTLPLGMLTVLNWTGTEPCSGGKSAGAARAVAGADVADPHCAVTVSWWLLPGASPVSV